MLDERLRALERRFRESGSLDDEIIFLRERLRVGDIDGDRIDLAAACGRSAARTLTRRAPYSGADTWVWAAGLVLDNPEDQAWGRSPADRIAEATTTWASRAFAREVCVRVCIAAAESVIGVASHPIALTCIGAAREWLATRSVEAVVRAAEVADASSNVHESMIEQFDFDEGAAGPSAAALQACSLAAGAAAVEGTDLKAAPRTTEAAMLASSPERVRAAVESDLIRWALGYV